jgi:hypothetical protein
VARIILGPDDFKMLRPATLTQRETPADVGAPGEPVSSLQALASRQEPPCFDGMETVSRLRPFFRRRDNTSRPQRVAIRARKPCLLIRRRFRGLYDGFMRF